MVHGELGQTWSFRGSKSRNKVSVGEPAEGSLSIFSCGIASLSACCKSFLALNYALRMHMHRNVLVRSIHTCAHVWSGTCARFSHKAHKRDLACRFNEQLE